MNKLEENIIERNSTISLVIKQGKELIEPTKEVIEKSKELIELTKKMINTVNYVAKRSECLVMTIKDVLEIIGYICYTILFL